MLRLYRVPSSHRIGRATFLYAAIGLVNVDARPAPGDETGFLQVPVWWVAVEGSPIAEAANTTELLMTRARLSNIFMNRAGISLLPRTSADTEFQVPVINDPNHPNSVELANGAALGDIHVDFSGAIDSHEVRQVRRNAKQALGIPVLPALLTRSLRVGVIGIATGRFNRDNGMPKDIIGWGSRVRRMFLVEDPRRSSLIRPPAPVDDPLPLSVLDRDAVLVAHEMGHVLGLDHRMAADAIMNPVVGAWAPGVAPVFGPGERERMQDVAGRLRGTRVDPPGVFEPGPVVGGDFLDQLVGDENPNPIPEFLDLDGGSTRFDQTAKTVAFEQDLWGLIPKANLAAPLHYWTLVDRDDNKATGAPGALLAQFGLTTAFDGVDLAIRADVSSSGQELTAVGQAWEFVGNQVFEVPANGVSCSVVRDILEPMYGAGATPPSTPEVLEMNDIVLAELNNSALQAPFTMGAPFKMQLVAQQGGANPVIWDRLDDQEQGAALVFENPQYPDAFIVDAQGKPIAGQFKPGEIVSAVAHSLKPDHAFEMYLDNVIVGQGAAGPSGDATAQFAVPPAMAPGFHTLEFVSSGTAITAANVLEVLVGADFNLDGDVGGADLAQWQGDFNLNGDSDADGDGDSDGADFLAWQRQLGAGSSATPAGGVPEPAAWSLLALAASALRPRRAT
jgi:hypothetical protein